MNIYEATLSVIDALEACQMPYMLVGSLSSMYYGFSRSTTDADFVVQFGSCSIEDVLSRLGPQFRFERQMAFELFTATVRSTIEVINSPLTIELFQLSDDPHDQERFQRRKRVNLLDRDVFLPTAEDVIITKLRWQRRKDLDDVRDVIAVQGVNLDWDYIVRWTDQHGTRAVLDELRTSIPPLDE
jgi:hypothetical protein